MTDLRWYLSGAVVSLALGIGCSSSDGSGPEPRADSGPNPDVSMSDAAEGAPPDSNEPETVADVRDEAVCGGACIVSLCVEGACVECTLDAHCGAGKPRCDVTSHTCVECVGGPTDNCPAGQYCSAEHHCLQGCKNNAACSSGVCNAIRECEPCENDGECSQARVCGTGICRPACTTAQDCGDAGLDCCNGHCVNTAIDVGHCGSCTIACNGSQFCGTNGCAGVSISNICANGKTTKLLDGLAADDASNDVIQNGLASICSPPPMTESSMQNLPGLINLTTGQPVAGSGNLLTVTGGYVVQKLVKYLDSVGATPIYLVAAANEWDYRGRAPREGGVEGDGSADPVIASIRYDQVTPSHDLFLVELVRDPTSGTLALIVFGQEAQSTAAGAWFFANEMLPNRANYGKGWYVYEWTGADDAGPASSDTFNLVASGP